MSALASGRRLALLDRDGTIIIDKVYLADPDGVEFAAGAIAGMRLLRDAGYDLALVTNQSGIARGYLDEAMLDRIHARLAEMLAAEGLAFATLRYCPHGPDDGCACRKPAPGMLLDILAELGVAAEQACMIGDSDADMGAARAAGVAGVRIGTAPGDAPDFLAAARRALALQGDPEAA